MLDDGDRILDAVGAVLLVSLVVGVGVVALNFDPPAEDPAPDAEWSIERVDATYVTVVHAGGDPVRTGELRVTVDSIRRETTWSDPVRPGDSTRVAASEGTLVRVVWLGGRGNRAVMAEKRL